MNIYQQHKHAFIDGWDMNKIDDTVNLLVRKGYTKDQAVQLTSALIGQATMKSFQDVMYEELTCPLCTVLNEIKETINRQSYGYDDYDLVEAINKLQRTIQG